MVTLSGRNPVHPGIRYGRRRRTVKRVVLYVVLGVTERKREIGPETLDPVLPYYESLSSSLEVKKTGDRNVRDRKYK